MFWDAKLGTFHFFSIALHEVRLKNSMCRYSCQLACNLLHSFQLLSWDWAWMFLWILMLFSILYCTAGILKQCRNICWVITLCLDCNGSDVVDCISVAVGRYKFCLLVWLIAVASGKRFCAGLIFWDASPGLMSCFNAEYRWAFLCLRILAGDASWQDSGCSWSSVLSF